MADSDIETLKLVYERLQRDVTSELESVRRDMQYIGGSLATAAVVLGLFGAFRPDKADVLPSVLFLLGLIPFVAVVLLSLFCVPLVRRTALKALADEEFPSTFDSDALARLQSAAAEEQTDPAGFAGFPPEFEAELASAEWLSPQDSDDLETWLRRRIFWDREVIKANKHAEATSYRYGGLITIALAIEVAYLSIVTAVSPFI